MLFNTPGVLEAYSASQGSKNSPTPAIGTGGSMARFALVGNYMYTVDDQNLNIFNIANSNDPVFSNQTLIDWHFETIYPFKIKFLIG